MMGGQMGGAPGLQGGSNNMMIGMANGASTGSGSNIPAGGDAPNSAARKSPTSPTKQEQPLPQQAATVS
jgi:hypothetical protein